MLRKIKQFGPSHWFGNGKTENLDPNLPARRLKLLPPYSTNSFVWLRGIRKCGQMQDILLTRWRPMAQRKVKWLDFKLLKYKMREHSGLMHQDHFEEGAQWHAKGPAEIFT